MQLEYITQFGNYTEEPQYHTEEPQFPKPLNFELGLSSLQVSLTNYIHSLHSKRKIDMEQLEIWKNTIIKLAEQLSWKVYMFLDVQELEI